VLQGPGENPAWWTSADGLTAAFKMESHNIIRVTSSLFKARRLALGGIFATFFTWARVRSRWFDSLRSGRCCLEGALAPEGDGRRETIAAQQAILDGVVRGIAHYGIASGFHRWR